MLLLNFIRRILWNRQVTLFNRAMDILRSQPLEIQVQVAHEVMSCMWELDKKAMHQTDYENHNMFMHCARQYRNHRQSLPAHTNPADPIFASVVLMESWCVERGFDVPAEPMGNVICTWEKSLQPYWIEQTVQQWKDLINQPSNSGASAYKVRTPTPENNETDASLNSYGKPAKESCAAELDTQRYQTEAASTANLADRLEEFKRKKALGLIGNWQDSSPNRAPHAEYEMTDSPLGKGTADDGAHSISTYPEKQTVSPKWIFYSRSGLLFNSSNGNAYTPKQYKRVQGTINGFEIMHGKDVWANDLDIAIVHGIDAPEEPVGRAENESPHHFLKASRDTGGKSHPSL